MAEIKTILIAEDEAVNRIYFSRVLGKEGFTVEEAINGAEAVEKALENSYDLILMDIKMPLLSGLDATKKIRRLEGDLHRHTPIIALTSYTYPDDIQEYREAGMDDYLPKPLNNRKLLSTVHRFLDPVD